MSRGNRETLAAELGAAVRANQAATDAFDEATAAYLGINRTDLRCLDILLQELGGQAIPSQLGARVGLSTGSVTAMIDRLERLGYVTRSPDPADRRRVVVRPTETVVTKVMQVIGPLVEEGNAIVARYTVEQMRLLTDFQQRSRELQEKHVKRVRDLGG